MKIIVNSLAIEYEDHGTGPVMLFLHGWQDTLHTFDALASVFSNTYRVIALDLPGFGKSELPKGVWGLDEYVRLVRAFTEKLGISVNVLVGHSFGGRIAIKGVATRTLQTRKLVLIASAGIAKLPSLRSSMLRFVARIARASTSLPFARRFRTPLRKKLYARIGSDYFAAGPLRDTFLKVIHEDLTASAGTISVPTLLVWGNEDTATPLSDGETFARTIRGAELCVFSGAGHFVHQEKTDEVAAAIKEFIQT